MMQCKFFLPYILFVGLLPIYTSAQQTKITDFVVFGGNGSCPSGIGQKTPLFPGCGVLLGKSVILRSGSIGSYNIIKSGDLVNIGSNILSGGSVQLGNSVQVNGNIAAANNSRNLGTVVGIGTSLNLLGNLDAAGNIAITSGTVKGKVTYSVGSTYAGPIPTGGNVTGPPNLPILPTTPSITNFPAAGTVDITTTQTITPGSYGNVALTGKQKITLSGPGVYVFKQIKNTGSKNYFIYDFKKTTSGYFYIYVYNDIDFNIQSVKILNGGNASRIYFDRVPDFYLSSAPESTIDCGFF